MDADPPTGDAVEDDGDPHFENTGELMAYAEKTWGKQYTEICGALGVRTSAMKIKDPNDGLRQLKALWG